MILIVADDIHADRTPGLVYAQLRAAGAETLLVDSDAFRAGRANLSLTWAGGEPVAGRLVTADATVALSDLSAVWFWRPWFGQHWPESPEAALPRDAEIFFRRQWQKLTDGLGLLLSRSGIFCVNPFPEFNACEEKVWQLELARSLGMAVPETLLTTDLSAARAFYDQHGGDIIYKTLAMPMIKTESDTDRPERISTVFTSRVRPETLEDANRFLPTPCIFQKRIDKAFEVRATIVGRRVFAATIDSQASERARQDWRRYDDENTHYGIAELPPAVETALITLTERLGLHYGAADLIVTPAGEYVFLELNPNGQFRWIELLTGLPISAALAAMLMAAGPAYALKESSHVGIQ